MYDQWVWIESNANLRNNVTDIISKLYLDTIVTANYELRVYIQSELKSKTVKHCILFQLNRTEAEVYQDYIVFIINGICKLYQLLSRVLRKLVVVDPVPEIWSCIDLVDNFNDKW